MLKTWALGKVLISWGWSSIYYPLVNIQKAIEHGPVEIVDDYPAKTWVDFPVSKTLVR